MKVGVALPSFATDGYRPPPGYIQQYARRAESWGFAGVWTTEHLIRPPAYNSSRLDPLTTVASVMGATESVGIGTSILILPMRNPVLVAKRAATIQHLSGDRLSLGLGAGWYDKEYESVNVPFEERGARFTEAIELLVRLFNEDEVTFDGEFYSVEEFTLEPSLPRPPRVLLAGGSKVVDGKRRVPRSIKDRILKYADGWIGAARSPEVLVDTWDDIESYLAENDQNPDALDKLALNWGHIIPNANSKVAKRHQRRVYSKAVGPDRGIDFAMEHNLTGSADEIRQQISTYEEAGFDQVIVGQMTYDRVELDNQHRALRDEVLSAFQY